LVFPVTGASFCLVYLWSNIQEVKIGYRITELRQQIKILDENIGAIESKTLLLKSPDKILTRISPDLKITSVDRIVHLAKIDKSAIKNNADGQFFSPQTQYTQLFKKKLPDYTGTKDDVCYLTKNKQ